jgi:hypothetical protein
MMARRSKAAAQAGGDAINGEDGAGDRLRELIVAIPSEMWAIDNVLMDPNNARRHDRKSIDGIKGSIAKFGQVESLLVRKATGVLIAGEGRLVAMKELGYTHVEVKPLPVDATTATALSLALNKTAELSYFDFESVAAQIKGLKADGFAVDVLGWAAHELEPLLQAEWKPPALNSIDKGEDKPKDKPHAVIFSEEQWPVIYQAILKLRDMEGDENIKEPRCIELMVADWSSRN